MKSLYWSIIKQVRHPITGELIWKHRIQEIPGVDYVPRESVRVDPGTGAPLQKGMLVIVGSIDHLALKDDPELVPLPQASYDTKVSYIHTQTKLGCMDALIASGLPEADVADMFVGSNSMRDVVNNLGRRNNPDFDANDFDLDEGG